MKKILSNGTTPSQGRLLPRLPIPERRKSIRSIDLKKSTRTRMDLTKTRIICKTINWLISRKEANGEQTRSTESSHNNV